MLTGFCWDDSYTESQWLWHRWPQAKVHGSSPGGGNNSSVQPCHVRVFPINQ